jgi:hypothetical protein
MEAFQSLSSFEEHARGGTEDAKDPAKASLDLVKQLLSVIGSTSNWSLRKKAIPLLQTLEENIQLMEATMSCLKPDPMAIDNDPKSIDNYPKAIDKMSVAEMRVILGLQNKDDYEKARVSPPLH